MAEFSSFHDFRTSRTRDQISALKTRHGQVAEMATEATDECRTLAESILAKRTTESEIRAKRDLLEMRLSRLTQSLAQARHVREGANEQLKSSTSVLQESRNEFSRSVMNIAESSTALMKSADTVSLKQQIERLKSSIAENQKTADTLQKGRMTRDEAKNAKLQQVKALRDTRQALDGETQVQQTELQKAQEESSQLSDRVQQLTNSSGDLETSAEQHNANIATKRREIEVLRDRNDKFDEAKIVEELCAAAKAKVDAEKKAKASEKKDDKQKKTGGDKPKAESEAQTKWREEIQRFDWMRAALIRNLRDVSSDIYALVRDLEKVENKTPTCLICKRPCSSDEYVAGITTDIQMIGKEIDAVPQEGTGESQDQLSQVAG